MAEMSQQVVSEGSLKKHKSEGLLPYKHECESLNDGIKFLLNIITATFEKNIFIVKIFVKEEFKGINLISVKKLQKKFKDQGIVILISAVSGSNFLIYWKSKEIQQLLLLKPYKKCFSEADGQLCEFVVDFLGDSLQNRHLGINQNLDFSSNTCKIELHSLTDNRDYNLLLLAAESGNVELIGSLLRYGISSELILPDGLVTAQGLAWHGRHFGTLLMQLQANLPFPPDIEVDDCSEELRKFIESSLELHKMIETQNEDKLDEILKNNPNLKYFYNLSNDSALKAALDLKLIDIYEFLISKNLSFAPHEDTEEIWEQFTKPEKIQLRNINLKYLKDIPEKHINILMLNTSLSHDEADEEGKRKLILRAYKSLNADSSLKIILKVVAATKIFRIIFDFDRDSTCRIDPVTTSATKGIFYFSGRIIIGAKQLLDQETERETFGVLIHELCHYAVLTVYQNQSDPFVANDQAAKDEFGRIVELCKANMDQESIIESVFEDYPEEFQASELIVRPAQLIALYGNKPEDMQKVRETFAAIFDYFERILIPDMERALPEIEGRLVYKATHTYAKLSDENKLKISNCFVKYKSVEVQLCELFPENSGIFENLTSDHISLLLKNEVLDLSDPQLRYMEEQISLKWENLPKKLKKKFLKSNLNFQGEIVKFEALNEACPGAFSALTSQQIIEVLINKRKFSIGVKFEAEAEFYVERSFIPEDAKLIDFEYEYGHDYVYDSSTSSQRKEFRTKNTNFWEFTENFLSQSNEDISKILQKVKENASLKLWSPNLNHEHFHFMYRNLRQIIEVAEKDKILILSSEAGAGKTSTFENLVGELKSVYPSRWVLYVDLAKHTKLYKVEELDENVSDSLKTEEFNENILSLLKTILNLQDQNNNFEVKIFEECYKTGNLVLIWNGFDEITPIYNEFIVKTIKSIYKTTSNLQFVSTRPLYSEQLSKTYNNRTWQLVPFDEDKKVEFLRKIFISKNVESEKIEENIQKIEKIIEKLKFKDLNAYFFNTPLILKLLTEISNQKVTRTSRWNPEQLSNDSPNIYKIFESFIERKIEIWLQKSKNSFSIAKKLILSGSIKLILQKYAILNEFRIFSSTTLGLKLRKLQIMQLELPQDLTSEEISSLGILFINGKNEFEFSHKTLAEFFVAQYFIENLLEVQNVDEVEAELRLELFYHLTKVFGDVQQIITDFMASYLHMNSKLHKTFNATISKLLTTKFKNFFIKMLNTNNPKVFEFLFKFFKSDHDLLIDLLHVHEDETLYTAVFNPNHFSLSVNPEEIENLAQDCLTDDEFRRFLIGRNQVGKILLGSHFYWLLGVTKSNTLDIEVNLNFGGVYGSNILGNKATKFSLEVGEASEPIKPKSVKFWEFCYKIKSKLTIGEQKALFVTALSPKIYLFYTKLFSTSDFSEYSKLWTNFENLLTPPEKKEALGNAIVDYFEIEAGEKVGHENFLTLLIEKAENFLSDSQIYEMFMAKNILHKAHGDPKNFEILWNFLESHTNEQQQRQILLKDESDDKNFNFHYSYDEVKNLYSNYEYSYYYFDFIPFKILHKSLTIPNTNNFEFTKQIYENLFNKTEIQDIIASSNDFICYVIGRADIKACRNFVIYLKQLFEGNESKLKKILDQKSKPTNLTVFELVEDFRGLSHSESHWFENLETFVDLRSKLASCGNF